MAHVPLVPVECPPLIHRSSALGGRDLNADRHVFEPDRGTVGPRRRVRSPTGQSGEGRIGALLARGLGTRKDTALGADRPGLIGGRIPDLASVGLAGVSTPTSRRTPVAAGGERVRAGR